jgi:hypothetical protein
MYLLSKRMLAFRVTTTSALLAALVVGCAAPSEHPALEEADAAVERARGEPRVRALAAAELDRAEVALEQARASARAGAPADQVEHLAYVVSQRAALAEARAAERIARSEIGELQRALGQVLADGRLEQGRFTRTPLRTHPQRRGLGQARLEQDRLAWASPAQRDQQVEVPLEEDRRERASVQQEQETRAPLKQDQLKRAPMQQGLQTRAPPEEGQSERALGDMRLDRDRAARASSAQADQRADLPLEADQQTDAALEADRQQRASMQQDSQIDAVREDGHRDDAPVQQADMPLEQDQHERASVHEDGQAPAGLQQARASVAEHQDAPRTEPDDRAAIAGTMLQDITLSLAQLRFEGAAPTSDTLEELAALAERLLGEPGRSILIEADFDLPGPEARTEMERRVEAVRAILVRRGIEPARLVVRPAGAAPAEPPASSSVVAPPH